MHSAKCVGMCGVVSLTPLLSLLYLCETRYEEAVVAPGASAPSTAPKFSASDLESIDGKYNTVTCLDVMIHYPQDKVDDMVTHLASLSDDRLIISFAPKTLACKCPIHTVKPRRACCCD